MARLLKAIADHFPRRQKRFWRYVSPRRRYVSVLGLSFLLVATAAYWHMTNSQRIRIRAEKYLREITGCHVSIRDAKFRMFGQVELSGVSVNLDVDGRRQPFFSARTVFLRHSPAGLLLKGNFEPTEVICISPVVTLLHDGEGEQALFSWAKYIKGAGAAWTGLMPKIRIRGGEISFVDAETDVQMFLARDVDVTMDPFDRRKYNVAFQGRSGQDNRDIWGRFDVDLLKGKVDFKKGSVSIQSFDEALPRKYRAWRQRYQVEGTLIPKPSDDDEPFTPQKMRFELIDVSLQLPEEEGGLTLQHVQGHITFDGEGITVDDVSGQVVQAGDAQFSITGRYFGYKVDSPFELNIEIKDGPLGREELTEALGEKFKRLDEMLRPVGKVNLLANMQRNKDGQLLIQGQAELLGISILYERFPYKLEKVTGMLEFKGNRVELKDLLVERGQARATAQGYIAGLGKELFYDLQFNIHEGYEIPLDEELVQALPSQTKKAWQMVSPTGFTGGKIRLHRLVDEPKGSVKIDMDLAGKTSMTYAGFPYPLKRLQGRIGIDGARIDIDALRSEKGQMGGRLVGYLDAIGSDGQVIDLVVKAWDVPIDEVLLRAIAHRNEEVSKEIRPVGMAEHVEVVISQSPDRKLSVEISAEFTGSQFQVDEFPYMISDAYGEIKIADQSVQLTDVAGKHGSVHVTINGRIWPHREKMGIELNLRARDLLLDDDLYQALPARVQETWKSLDLSGIVDAQLWIQRNAPDTDGELDFAMKIDAKDLNLQYEGFAYPLTGLTGQVAAVPGRIEIGRLTATDGSASVQISGTIVQEPTQIKGNLSIKGKSIPLNRKLLDALPGEAAPLVAKLKPTGFCDIDLKSVRFVKAIDDQADIPTSQPADSPAKDSADWNLEGSVDVKDAILDLGFGPKTITGRIEGSGGKADDELFLDAEVELFTVMVGHRKITDLTGIISKEGSSQTIHIKELFGKTMGGRMAGFADIRLTEPLQYRLYLDIEDIRLEEITADPSGKAENSDVKGLLGGRLELTTQSGKNARRQAEGVLVISQAKLKKLPVVLGLLHVVTVALPAKAALSDGAIVYRVDGDKLILEEIHFNGPSVGLMGPAYSLVGSGTIDMKTERLSLTFISDPAGGLPRLKSFNELLSGFVRELVEIQVTGTLSNPNTRAVGLRSIEEAMRRLLSPGIPADE